MRGLLKASLLVGMMAAGGAALAQGAAGGSFGDAVGFLRQHTQVIVLAQGGARVVVWPGMQGRVMTSSADGDAGRSFGWINRELIASGKVRPHMNAVGGEDRLWLGPEGGQFSIFFAKGEPFDLEHWWTPKAFDAEAFQVTGQTKDSVALRKEFRLTNYSGTEFAVRIDRAVRLLGREKVWSELGVGPAEGVKVVGFETENKLTNAGAQPWRKESGLLSLWVLGQFNAAEQATIVLPVREGSDAALGPEVKADYFGVVPANRIAMRPSAVFFRADAHYRSKLGVNPRRTKGVIGSYDPEHHVLTIVQFDWTAGAEYVNSAWELQKEPYRGDVANCYNDGPAGPGGEQMGNFYELESSSAAKELAAGASVEHVQRTIHLQGSEAALDPIARKVLGVGLAEVEQALGKQ